MIDPLPFPPVDLRVFGPHEACNQRGPDLPKERGEVQPYVWVEPAEVPDNERRELLGRRAKRYGIENVHVLIDSSASMLPHRSDMIGTVNEFLRNHFLTAPPRLTQIQMSYFNDLRWSRNNFYSSWSDSCLAPPLTLSEYHPSGPTALLDALGWAIDLSWSWWSLLPDDECPVKTLIAIFTDGEENASQKFCTRHIADLMQHFREKKGWRFCFLAGCPEGLTSDG